METTKVIVENGVPKLSIDTPQPNILVTYTPEQINRQVDNWTKTIANNQKELNLWVSRQTTLSASPEFQAILSQTESVQTDQISP